MVGCLDRALLFELQVADVLEQSRTVAEQDRDDVEPELVGGAPIHLERLTWVTGEDDAGGRGRRVVLHALIGTCDVSVDLDGDLEPERSHRTLLSRSRSRRAGLQLEDLDRPADPFEEDLVDRTADGDVGHVRQRSLGHQDLA